MIKTKDLIYRYSVNVKDNQEFEIPDDCENFDKLRYIYHRELWMNFWKTTYGTMYDITETTYGAQYDSRRDDSIDKIDNFVCGR